MLHRISLICVLLLAAMLAGPSVRTAQACPNCKEGLKTDNKMPMAYQYSIVFMLAVPAMLFSGFGYGFYRLSRQNALQQQDLDPEVLVKYDARVDQALHQRDAGS